MKVPETVRLSFNPETSTLNLKDPVYAALWGCLKVGHITDQYFTDHVETVTDIIKEKEIDTYDKFITVIRFSGLNKFGLISKDRGFCRFPDQKLDQEFWNGVWEYVSGSKTLKFEYLPV